MRAPKKIEQNPEKKGKIAFILDEIYKALHP